MINDPLGFLVYAGQVKLHCHLLVAFVYVLAYCDIKTCCSNSYLLFYFTKNEKVMFLLDSNPDLSFMTVTVGPVEDHCFHITIWQRLRAVIKCRLNKFHQHEDLK